MSWFLLNRNLTLLEPYDWKLSCTVLRGERGSNAPDLPGTMFLAALMMPWARFPGSVTTHWACALPAERRQIQHKAVRILFFMSLIFNG